jgi:small GTP-binding protein
MEFSTKIIEFEKSLVKAQLWDTAGQERFESMNKIYYRDALGAALVYDICNRDSFEHLKTHWIPQLRAHGHEGMKLILGIYSHHDYTHIGSYIVYCILSGQ